MHPLTVVILSAIVFRVGQAMWNAGAVRSKNAGSAIARQLCDLAIVTLASALVGPLFAPKSDTDAWRGVTLASAIIASSIIPLAIAERASFFAGWPVSAVLGGVVIPISVRLLMSQVSAPISTVTTLPLALACGAGAAVGAAWWVGSRSGRYHRDGSSAIFPAHQFVFVGMGAFILLIALFLPTILTTADPARTATSALAVVGAAIVTAVLWTRIRGGKTEVWSTVMGLCTASLLLPVAYVWNPWSAALMGVVATLLGFFITHAIDLKFRIDDVGGQVGLWWSASIVGTLSLLGHGAWAGVEAQVAGIIFGSAGVAFVLAIVALLGFQLACPIRVSDIDEYDGLDLAEHDVNAYPDFQQTTIKSYHTREA